MEHLVPLVKTPIYRDASGFVLSVSGGVDSMVMLDAMFRLQHVHGKPMRVVHIHHGTGKFADLSLALVEQYVASQELELKVFHYTHKSGNFEYESAIFRRRVLSECRFGHELVLLGHHQCDQAETFIMALARGAGIASPVNMEGLRGTTVRPLIQMSRRQILDHARVAGVPHVLDPTNQDGDRLRNAIRHGVLPVLNQFHEHSERRIAHWCEAWSRLQLALMSEAEQCLTMPSHAIPRTVFSEKPCYLWPFMLQILWRHNASFRPNSVQADQINDWLVNNEVGALDTKGGRVYVDHDQVTLLPNTGPDTVCVVNQPIHWDGLTISPEWSAVLGKTSKSEHQVMRVARQCPRRWRDRMRAANVPMRIRERLPEIWDGKTSIHILELLEAKRNGICSVKLSGKDERVTQVIQLIRRHVQT